MSKRPILKKQLARLTKSTRYDLPAHIDLVMWLKDHKHAQTSGQARRMLEDGKVLAGDHVIGRRRVTFVVNDETKETEDRWVATPVIRSELRDDLKVRV